MRLKRKKRSSHWNRFFFPLPGTVYDSFFKSRAKEQILDSGYETGKTIHLAMKIHSFAMNHPNLKIAVVRGVYADLIDSFVRTYEDKVLGYDPDPKNNRFVRRVGGPDKPTRYKYKNGSSIVLVGLDRNPNKVHGAEFDIIGVTQGEELTLEAYEKMQGRASGRAGNLFDENGEPYGMIFLDCNPDAEDHWLQKRKARLNGKTLAEVSEMSDLDIPKTDSQRLAMEWYYPRHEDNVLICDPYTKEYTNYGKDKMAEFATYTGMRYKRGVLHLWINTEGAVYDIEPEKYIINELPEDIMDWDIIRSIDFGYYRFVCLWIAKHPKKDYAIVFQEYRSSQLRVEQHGERIKELSFSYTLNELEQRMRVKRTVWDNDVDDRSRLRDIGIVGKGAKKDIRTGIDLCHQLLSDGRLKIYKNLLVTKYEHPYFKEEGLCRSLLEELRRYRYKPPEKRTGRNSKEDDLPLKEDLEDACDAMRYGARDLFESLDLKPKAHKITIAKKKPIIDWG